jgi:hypothetical protein
MWSKTFWLATLERAIKTFAQVLAALLGAEAVGVLEADWGQSASVAAMATVLSILTSVASSSVGNEGPSLVSAEKLSAPAADDYEGRHEA